MKKNVPASIHQRLLNISRAEKRRFNDLLQHYALERWLYRLSLSNYADRFILKGGLLLIAWNVPIGRATRDIDLLARMNNNIFFIEETIKNICNFPVEDDGLLFKTVSILTENIDEDAEYQGVRSTFSAFLGNARISMQIDIGFSDVVTPKAEYITYPSILNMSGPEIAAYNRETTIAEKFEAMVKLGELNSRMKDFFDVWVFAEHYRFFEKILSCAFENTFRRRGTALLLDAPCFQNSFAKDTSKQKQWKAFIKRSELEQAPKDFEEVLIKVMRFLKPIGKAISEKQIGCRVWNPGGPWVQENCDLME